MIGLLQRVTQAHVQIDQKTVGQIDRGILVLLGVEKNDSPKQAERMAERLLGYRVFADDQGKMNHSVMDCHGGVLIVPQFTLAADTAKGMRPGFSHAAPPIDAIRLYQHCVEHAKSCYAQVETGVFQTDMQVFLCNDGPVTLILKT